MYLKEMYLSYSDEENYTNDESSHVDNHVIDLSFDGVHHVPKFLFKELELGEFFESRE